MPEAATRLVVVPHDAKQSTLQVLLRSKHWRKGQTLEIGLDSVFIVSSHKGVHQLASHNQHLILKRTYPKPCKESRGGRTYF